MPDDAEPASSPAATPEPRKPRRRLLRKRVILLALVGVYAIYLAVAFAVQETFVFPRFWTASVEQQPTLPTGVESLWFEPEPGVRVEAWLFLPSAASAAAPVDLVVYTHGNAETIDDKTDVIQLYRTLGFACLMPEYRGYGRSTGTPTQTDLTTDIVAMIHAVRERPEIGDGLAYHGRSIGGGIAASVARELPPDRLLLESTFTSMRSMLGRYLVPSFLARNRMETNDLLQSLDIPLLLIHGDSDIIVPYKHAKRNIEASQNNPACAPLVTIEGAGHNDIDVLSTQYLEAARAHYGITQSSDAPPSGR